jgi:hypothetical protein
LRSIADVKESLKFDSLLNCYIHFEKNDAKSRHRSRSDICISCRFWNNGVAHVDNVHPDWITSQVDDVSRTSRHSWCRPFHGWNYSSIVARDTGDSCRSRP